MNLCSRLSHEQCQNPAATLSGATPSGIAHGSGNLVLTITGSGFLPGTAVNWNGAYRTTTFLDSGHLTVNIPASDLAAAG
jgi:trimeric autotransporter adhesin